MDKEVFDQFRAIVYSKSGISLNDSKSALVSSRINKRIRALGLGSSRDYLEYLISKDVEDEIGNFLDVISTNTTDFFREPAHFDFFVNAMGKWIEKKQRRFRIWCAASSSGEEPYTIAMTYLEHFGHIDADFKILATDISIKVLNTAREGIYSEEKMKKVPKALLDKYFVFLPEKGKGRARYQAKKELRDLILFKWINLSDPPFPMKGPVDIVFCRNVMIYFDNVVREKLVSNIHKLLRNDGYLMVGHSESLACFNSEFDRVQPAIYLKT